jgi:DNA replication and repair protein RecF
LNFIVGPNARGKTSLLEAACILLRLQSPRVSALARVIQRERKGFVTDGFFGATHLQFYYSRERKKLAIDGVEQSNAREWLQIGRVIWFGNEDIEIVRGSGEQRRRFLDFVGAQRDAAYSSSLRSYNHALRSRNYLLKQASPRWSEVSAFDAPLLEHGGRLVGMRGKLVEELQVESEAAHLAISGRAEASELSYRRADGGDFATALAAAKSEDLRLRQTTVGPHRDDLQFTLNGLPSEDASEGQQRTLVLALKLGASRLLERHFEAPPVLLIDDIFGELDPERRNALLAALPAASQKIITTTHLGWMPGEVRGNLLEL